MRLDVYSEDFDWGLSHRVIIYLDGVKQDYCVVADEEIGEIVKYVVSVDGRITGELQTKKGTVVIEVIDDPLIEKTTRIGNRQLKWDLRYLTIAKTVGGWSKDPSTKVGAVLVRPDNSIASTGFNGFPPGHEDSPELYADREYKYKHVVHAEANAINFLGGTLVGFTLYTSFPSCPECMELAGRAGIKRVVGPPLLGEGSRGKSKAWIDEWEQRILKSNEIADKYGIQLDVVQN